MSTDEPTKVCCDSIDLRIENGWLTEVHNHCTCGGSGIPSPAHLPGCGLVPLVPLADIIGMAEHDRQVAEQAFDEAVRALAWAMANGPDPLTYVREHNPYRRADSAAPARPTTDEREATPDEAHDIGYTKGHTDGYREAMAALAARPAPVVSGADDQAAAVKAVEQYPTLTVTAWNATPEQAEAIFEAAMDAAYAAAGDIALDGVATLVRRTVADTPAADDEGGQE